MASNTDESQFQSQEITSISFTENALILYLLVSHRFPGFTNLIRCWVILEDACLLLVIS